jgi:hypothetical protein
LYGDEDLGRIVGRRLSVERGSCAFQLPPTEGGLGELSDPGRDGFETDDEADEDGLVDELSEVDLDGDGDALFALGGGVAKDVDHAYGGGDGGGWAGDEDVPGEHGWLVVSAQD